ncbi:PHD finger protein ALFIN-LIKE 3 [Abeliophyllum distichum]|uniref:PHD finger protein ALFIN-LIKE n=1 Tax=Abeliophyllum distichum TaxID=126358 RepID=A0ABD1P9Q3_9LAMI
MNSRNDSIIHMIPTPKSVPEIFREFKRRRAGIIKALTIDFDRFYQECDPEKDALCLFGLPNETWEVKKPLDMVPPEFPDPVLGINIVRDDARGKEYWLSYVAVHSDAWLISATFYFASLCRFEKRARELLFDSINDLPTVNEVVSKVILAKNPAAAAAAAAAAAVHDNRSTRTRVKTAERKKRLMNREQHVEPVKLMPIEAEYIEHYKCPSCSNEGAKF